MKRDKVKRVLITFAIIVSITFPALLMQNQNNKLAAKITVSQNNVNRLLMESVIAKDKIKDLQKSTDELSATIKSRDAQYQNMDNVISQNKVLTEKNDALSRYLYLKKDNASRGSDNSNKTLEFVKVRVEISMYYRGECSGHKTASGIDPYVGVIAAPKGISFGTQLMIPGFKCSEVSNQIFTVEDRGGYIKKVGDVYRVDIFVEDRSTAVQFGRQTMDSYFIVSS